jgi:ubiquinone/menaquinone biosynthesis C-methylase UbiE
MATEVNHEVERPEAFWGDASSASWWVNESKRYSEVGDNRLSEKYIDSHWPRSASSILEVGAGVGRLIALFEERACYTVDINPGLCEYVKKRYPHVAVMNTPAHQIPLPDNSVDLIYTFQVLQHIPNDLISRTLQELLRVTNDRLWLMEGWKPDREQGEKTHRANGGSFMYYYDNIFDCESVEFVVPQKVKAYMIRKKNNPSPRPIEFGVK